MKKDCEGTKGKRKEISTLLCDCIMIRWTTGNNSPDWFSSANFVAANRSSFTLLARDREERPAKLSRASALYNGEIFGLRWISYIFQDSRGSDARWRRKLFTDRTRSLQASVISFDLLRDSSPRCLGSALFSHPSLFGVLCAFVNARLS
jgi:hypothetical protein